MLDINFIRENPALVQKSAKDKGIEININHILEIDQKYRELFLSVQLLREERNKIAKVASNAIDKKNIGKGKAIKEKLEKEEHALLAVKEELEKELLQIPNIAKKDVKAGKDETENEIVKKVGSPRKFGFTPLDHLTLGEKLDLIDVERAVKISGSRFYYFKNEAVLLEFALINFAFEVLMKEGFTPIIPPTLIKREIMQALGYVEHGGEEDMFSVPKDNLFLVGTSEQSIVPLYKDEILNAKNLPKRYVGFSSCFRREAGSYGKDTRGIIRAHQFDKVEMVSFTTEENDDKEHEYLLSLEEKLFKALAIPYQVVKMCTGDLGFPTARKYDIEAWIPSQNKYREITSTSTTSDFQARRLNIKYQESNEKKYMHILNGTAFSARPIAAILENYQQKDGSILIPKVLQKYLGKTAIIPRK